MAAWWSGRPWWKAVSTAPAIRPAALALAAWAAQAVPALARHPVTETGTNVAPRLAGGLPAIGRVRPGLLVATGHFRNGVLLTPITGEVIADLVAGRPPADAALAFDASSAVG